jgi:general secretion pathway protein K
MKIPKAVTVIKKTSLDYGNEAPASPRGHCLKNQNGIALVVTLLALAIITAMVVEFSYAVYTGTNNLYNWRDSQRLSVMAKSGINVSVRVLSDWLSGKTFSYPGSMDFPVENPFEDFSGTIIVRIEDENSKFNINSIVPENQNVAEDDDQSPYNMFKRLLAALSLDKKIADRVADWIDRDSESRPTGSETGAKNLPLSSVDELLSVNGISRKDYDTLSPYITVYGNRDAPEININGAAEPVLMSLSKDMTREDARRIIQYRESSPFEDKSDLTGVSGFRGSKGQSLMNKITVMGKDFSIKSVAASGGVKRIIETVFDRSTGMIEYWKEY